METRIRPAQEADRDVLLRMAERLQEGVAPWRDPAGVRRAVVGWVSDSLADLADPNTAAFVAERRGEVVGFICVSERAHFTGQVDVYIGELVVAKDAEGAGLGRHWSGRRRTGVAPGAVHVWWSIRVQPTRRLAGSTPRLGTARRTSR